MKRTLEEETAEIILKKLKILVENSGSEEDEDKTRTIKNPNKKLIEESEPNDKKSPTIEPTFIPETAYSELENPNMKIEYEFIHSDDLEDKDDEFKVSNSPNSKKEDEEEHQDRHDSNWNERFQQLLEFKEAHGHLYVPRKTEKQLNRWCITQRSYKKENKLSQDRILKLDSIGFQWGRSDSRQKEWDKQFERMRNFIEKHGHSSVPANKDKRLNKWVEKQRASRKNGIMSENRISRLDSIGFQWQGRDYAKDWLQNYENLKEFRERNGHVKVSQENNSELSKWIKYQNNLKRKGLLPEEKSKKLEELGIRWTEEKLWEQNWLRLREFKSTKGNLQSLEGDLKDWALLQKKAKQNNKLSQTKIERLEEIGFDWNLENSWEILFRKLKEFKKLFGNFNVVTKELQDFVENQRLEYSKKILPNEQFQLLDSIGFPWIGSQNDPEWNDRFNQLKEFVNSNGDGPLMVDKALYVWLRKQIVAKENGTLPREYETRLKKLGIWNRIGASQSPSTSPDRSASPRKGPMKVNVLISQHDDDA